LNPLVPEPARVVERHQAARDIVVLRLALVEPGARERFDFRPGQFNMVYAPGVGEVAISLSGDPADELIEHTIRIVGRTTRVLGRAAEGDTLGLRGPFGRGWPLHEARHRDLLVVTGGLGCAPVSGAIDYVMRRRKAYGRVTVLHGVKKPADLIHRERFDAWARQPDTRVLLSSDTADRSWRGHLGVVTGLFEEVDFDPRRTLLFLCGPEVMMQSAVSILRRRGLPLDRIFLSLERNMQCAVGLCGHCQLGPAFVCKDGPVFPYDRIGRFLREGRL